MTVVIHRSGSFPTKFAVVAIEETDDSILLVIKDHRGQFKVPFHKIDICELRIYP